MDTATAIAAARKVAKMADKVIKYIKADNEAAYGLDEEVAVVLMGDGVAYVGTALVPREYTTEDGALTIAQTVDAIDWGVRLVAHPFPASARLWNGPDVIADNQYRSMLASLFHDLIWGHADELARAWGVSKRDVLTWGNGVLYALWMYASTDSLRGRIEARLAWYACEFSKSWYHAFKRLVGLHCLAAALGLAAGCGSPPDWAVAEISGTNAVLRAMGRGGVDGAGDGGAEVVGNPDTLPTVAGNATDDAGAKVDEVEFAALDWCWGGFNGSKAARADGMEIAALKVTADGLSYKWARGGCEALDAASATDAACLACLFVRVGGKWRGGKFDWISTSRISRDFKNIRDGYGGWQRDAIESAEAFAFVIVSKDGGKRSNVINAGK